MTVLHPLFALALLFPLVWVVLEWRRGARKAPALLQALAFAAIVVALCQPVLRFRDTRTAVALLLDTSASVTQQDLAKESRLLRSAAANKAGALGVLAFGRSTRALSEAERNSGRLRYSAGEAGRATDIDSALRQAVLTLPAGSVRKVALASDGHENTGDVTRAIWQLQQLNIPVDVFPLAGRRSDMRVEAVSAPGSVFSGERFPISLTVTAPRAMKARITLEAEGRKIGEQPMALTDGLNRVQVRAAVNTTGATDLIGTISSDDSHGGEPESARFEYALSVRRPRALLITQDPPESNQHLKQILSADQFDLESNPGGLPFDLSGYQLIIFSNVNLEQVPVADQRRLEDFEQQGGGVLWIAGERNVYVDRKGGAEPPLARALPAKIAPPRSPQGKCVVLIIDKSSSMEGKKIELARLAATGVVDNLKPDDSVGVLIFDNSFQWAVPIRRAVEKAQINQLISGITPDGGTQIAPALAEAYGKVLPIDSVYKHIVLLTDGISEEGDSVTMAHEAAANHVTISTVGLGQDVNRSYLEKIASNAKGKSYFLLEPSGLEQIVLKDVEEHTGTTAVEKPLKAETVRNNSLLDGVDLGTAPALAGYIRFEARPGSEQILRIDKDPLLVRWQYGLGRAAVFASDAKNRWAANWLAWRNFDQFWTNIVRDLLPQAPQAEATAQYDSASGELSVDYREARGGNESAKPPEIYALGPGGFRQPMAVAKTRPGAFHAHVQIGNRQGLFRVLPLKESRAFPEIGLYRSEEEFNEWGADERLLKEIAAATGGRYNPSLETLFDPGGRWTPAQMPLWPGLLGVAVLLNLAELIVRKWKGLIGGWLPSRMARQS